MMMRVASWNICLGLKNKKDYIYQVVKEKNIDICLLQEVEVEKDFETQLLSDKDYKIEVETNTVKSRTAILIKDNIQYERMLALEEENNGIVIIDIFGKTEFHLYVLLPYAYDLVRCSRHPHVPSA